MREHPLILIPIAAFSLALAACGDDSTATDASASASESGSTAASASATEGSTGAGESEGATDTDTGADTGGEAEGLLPPSEHLIRISMALRGKRPSEADLAKVEEDPATLPGIVDAYLASAELGPIIRDLHNDALLSIVDFGAPPAGFLAKGAIAGTDPYAVNRSIMEAPLRLVEHIVVNDRPYTEIVTADYTLADNIVATVWGLDHSGTKGKWEETSWQGKRAHAGVLSDSWLFTRHSSTVTNANRGRANAMSRALLCYDFLDRDIELDPSVNLADPNVVAEAVQSNQACAACHQALDPMASFFSGYLPNYTPALIPYPLDMWVEGLFPILFKVNMRDPAFFGAPGDDLADLGDLIADDPRFSLCAARRFYAYFHQVELDDVPLAEASALQSTLVEGGFQVKPMIKELVLSDAFRVAEGERGRKQARPIQLAALIDDLTGFRWRTDLSAFGVGVIDLMDDSLIGYHVLAGGIDSLFVTRPSNTPSATTSLVLQGIARNAANIVVTADFAQADKGKRRLLTLVDAGTRDDATLRDQLVALHRRLYGEALAADDPVIDASLELLKGALALANDDGARAWKITLTALLQDVRIAFY
ncbi:MAG: DUF1588 domain-containing protein [Myxococcales bacterium]|nr:DUF1588 domain-containing protein [Myxococcales bacterium]